MTLSKSCSHCQALNNFTKALHNYFFGHSGENRNPGSTGNYWIPACAGMTKLMNALVTQRFQIVKCRYYSLNINNSI